MNVPRALAAAWRASARGLVDGQSLLLFAAGLAAWSLGAALVGGAGALPGESFRWRALLVWAPGLFGAFALRRAWPALGPGDAGRAFVAARPPALRALLPGAVLAGALPPLALLAALAATAATLPLPPGPAFTGRSLAPQPAPGLVLRAPGDALLLDLPPGTAALRLRPRALFGAFGSVRLALARPGSRHPLAAAEVWEPEQPALTFHLPPALRPATRPRRLALVRAGGDGPALACAGGPVLAVRGLLRPLALWADLAFTAFVLGLAVTACSLALQAWTGRPVQALALLLALPTLPALFPGPGAAVDLLLDLSVWTPPLRHPRAVAAMVLAGLGFAAAGAARRIVA